MGVLFIAGVASAYWAEAHGNDALTAMGLTGGNMEGKEVRFGIVASALFASSPRRPPAAPSTPCTTRFTALGGMIPADQHPARRGHRRRRRRRHVRHAAVRDHLDLRRRPDGGPHARSTSARRSRPRRSRWPMLAILILPLMYSAGRPVAGR
jgi:hypothetical protein